VFYDGDDEWWCNRAVKMANDRRMPRVWAPDPHAPGFRQEAVRQSALLRGAPDEQDALDVIEAAADLRDWTA
jgi:hypothetical protein